MKDLGSKKRKILFLILGGATILLNRSPGKRFDILKTVGKGWQEIKKEEIKRKIWELYRSKLINAKFEKDGNVSLTLTKEGKTKLLKYQIDSMKIKNQKWDGKWRMVIFDIPEEQKKERDAFRFRLKRLGFHELQKSVFVHPLDCQEEIEFFTEFYNIVKNVRFGILEKIDNEIHLKTIFDL
ncbi:MAG: Transcriptional regulator, PaaX family [Parcubacteria group bacterium GW2011_GWA1_42_7]|nr:MAG: Transcriptional regulator, PaaX family [Parcubacteria group bacterium GW2011_GWB1_42_6]KKS70235.1 MAG: Transcriptional regulator, PaaX family [Parcubacteria group bacterium GW2011_GWA1_42_7]KKS92590.1 MAG: Transcriptional regulator, PaaX family [Parcubacteria group bacterium GW2011_GWC1_43_12]